MINVLVIVFSLVVFEVLIKIIFLGCSLVCSSVRVVLLLVILMVV